MPTKTTKEGRAYEVSGRDFTWTTEDGDKIVIPLRLKLKVIRKLGATVGDLEQMNAILDELIPDQGDTLGEMDVMTDFQPMFRTWQSEYEALSGATLGESAGSSI